MAPAKQKTSHIASKTTIFCGEHVYLLISTTTDVTNFMCSLRRAPNLKKGIFFLVSGCRVGLDDLEKRSKSNFLAPCLVALDVLHLIQWKFRYTDVSEKYSTTLTEACEK